MSFEPKIFKVIEPKSFTNPDYADHEFLLAWYNRNGAYNQYMFTDWTINNNTDSDILNLKDKNNLENIPSNEERQIKLYAEDLSYNDLQVMLGIKTAKKVTRIYKDGTYEYIGIDNNSFTYKQSDARYNFEFNIILYQRALPQ